MILFRKTKAFLTIQPSISPRGIVENSKLQRTQIQQTQPNALVTVLPGPSCYLTGELDVINRGILLKLLRKRNTARPADRAATGSTAKKCPNQRLVVRQLLIRGVVESVLALVDLDLEESGAGVGLLETYTPVSSTLTSIAL